MNIKIATEAHLYYQCGASLAKVSDKYGITRQRLHYYFKAFGLKTRSPIRKPKIYYNGNYYTVNNAGYYRKTDGDRKLLHAQKWNDNYGDIPKGMQIHHKDGDKLNNELSNYELISISDHSKLHGFTNNQFTIKNPHKYDYSCGKFCFECGLDFINKDNKPGYNINRFFCSMECKRKHMKGKRRGYSPRRIYGIITGAIK